MTVAFMAGAVRASLACVPLVPPAVRAEVEGWTLSCPPRGSGAPCSFERAAERTRIGVWVSSTTTDVMYLSVLAPVARISVRTAPDAAPIELECVTSHAMCEPELISHCPVSLGRAAELAEALAAEHDIAVVLDDADGASRVLDAKGFPAAWARYSAMLREQRGRAIRWFALPEPAVRRGTGRG
jgi:hypothetical protein